MRETLQMTGGRSVLRLERTFGHPPQRVWEALTEPGHLARWFPSEVELEPRVGGAVRFVFRAGQAPASEGVVTEFDPPRALAYTWFDDLLRWELHARDGACLLVFTHTFDDHAGAASFASGWDLCLAGMERVLAGQPVDDMPDDGTLHESYVQRLGLGRGTAHDTDDGWVVRFERQLTRPAEEVWARLGGAGTDTPVPGGRVPRGFRVAQVPAGAVTAVAQPELLEYEWLAGGRPGGRVRWRLTAGTGHGARLELTQTGGRGSDSMRATALDAWRDHIADLAARLLTPPAPPAVP